MSHQKVKVDLSRPEADGRTQLNLADITDKLTESEIIEENDKTKEHESTGDHSSGIKQYSVSIGVSPVHKTKTQQYNVEVGVTESRRDNRQNVSVGATPRSEPEKLAKRADAEILTRPAGYKELELSTPQDALTFDLSTMVTPQSMDQDLADEGTSVWPTAQEFNIPLMQRKLEDYVKSYWTLDDGWLFSVVFIQMQKLEFGSSFIFEVKFSQPSPNYPVTQETASVFFRVDIGHYDLKADTVKVRYVVEGNRFSHSPGMLPFQQKWLYGIISEKIKLRQTIDF